MEFIRKNYEKIILGGVLLGLVGVLAFMPVMIYYDNERMTDLKNTITHRKPEPLPPLDLSRQQTVLNRLKSPYELDFSTTNKLFNPVQWQRTKDNRIVKAAGLGPNSAVVTKITPLYFVIAVNATVDTNGIAARYAFNIEDQSAGVAGQRRKRSHYASLGKGNDTVIDKTVAGKNEGFTLIGVKGPPENPDELVLKLADTGLEVPVSKDKPYRRVDGYTADLKYDPEKYSGTALRVGDHLAFSGDDYNIIAIDGSEVILLAQSNQKKFTLRYAP